MSDFPNNRDLSRFEPGEWAGYIDCGLWELEQWMGANTRLMQHFHFADEDLSDE